MAKRAKKTARGARLRSTETLPASAAAPRTGTINDFIGCLAGKTKKVATIEEINLAAQDGWAGKVRTGKK
jgi:hypothetical protein